MWTEATRRQHSRDHLRYGSDVSDEEWEIIAPFMPLPAKTGRPREWTMRTIINGIFYVLRAGCPWRMLPKCFPPMTTVYGWFLRFRREGLFEPSTTIWSWRIASRSGGKPRLRRR
jgi:putative transposase